MTRAHAARGWLALGLLLGCSSAKSRPQQEECTDNADCFDGEVCFADVCRDATELPPLADLGFDISERGTTETLFRAQIWGCDNEVPDPGDTREIDVRRREVSQRFQLSLQGLTPVVAPGEGEVAPVAKLELSQATRLARGSNPMRREVDYPVPVLGGDPPVEATISWPRYHPYDQRLAPPHLVFEGRPPASAPVVAMFRPPIASTDELDVCTTDAECCEDGKCELFPNFCLKDPGAPEGRCTLIGDPTFSYPFNYEPLCDRAIAGEVTRFDLQAGTRGEALAEASVRLRHADTPGEPRLGVFDRSLASLADAEPECETDSDCGSADLICEPETSQCQLAIAGRNADPGSVATTTSGVFDTRVYTYCEALPTGAPVRSYTVTVTPPLGTPYPSMSYAITETFSAGIAGQSSTHTIPQPFCVPDWGTSAALEIELQGSPRELIEGDGRRCCDVGCLPATADTAEPSVSQVTSCDGRTAAGVAPSVRFESNMMLDEDMLAAMEEADCATPVPDTPARLVRDADCTTPGPCLIGDLAPGSLDAPREYSVRVESPVGSVLGSKIFTMALGPDGEPTPGGPLELPARVLVRGQVQVDAGVCERRDPEDDCRSQGAVVLAERIAASPQETTATVAGPYLHQVTTHYDPVTGQDGAFVLPLDRGIWVLTALPGAGEDGGPAPYVALDLREGVAPEPLTFELSEGVLVTLNLRTFDRRTAVVPLDLGTWSSLRLDSAPEVSFDLDNPRTCLSAATDGPQGCRIRALIAPGSNLSLNQIGLALFTARKPSGGAATTCGP